MMREPTRMYVGNLSRQAIEDDLWQLFKEYRPTQVALKQGFAFVDFKSRRALEEAIRYMDGSRVCDCRIKLEMAKFQSPIRSLPPLLSNGCKRLRVSNLNRKSNWKELKQLVRRYIDVPHVDCNNKRAGEGYIECYNHSDCKHLYNRLNGVRFEGHTLKLSEYKPNRRSTRSRSPDRKRFRHYNSLSPQRHRDDQNQSGLKKSRDSDMSDSVVSQQSDNENKNNNDNASFDSYHNDEKSENSAKASNDSISNASRSVSPARILGYNGDKIGGNGIKKEPFGDFFSNSDYQNVRRASKSSKNIPRVNTKSNRTARTLIDLKEWSNSFYSEHLATAFTTSLFLNQLLVKVENECHV